MEKFKKFIIDIYNELGLFVLLIIGLPFLILSLAISRLLRPLKPRLMFGTTPLISNKYWSKSMTKLGYKSKSIMSDVYYINNRTDYDFVYDRLFFHRKIKITQPLALIMMFYYVLYNYDIIHTTFNGILYQGSFFFKLEIIAYKLAGIKIIVMPYGGDSYVYSQIQDFSLKHVLLNSYPKNALLDRKIQKKIYFFTKYADCISTGFMIDLFPRWDILPFSNFIIDINQWKSRQSYSLANGTNGVVKIIHSPNHRAFKGTEYLIQAIDELKEEGLKIELILIEKKTNEYVYQKMYEADILAEQFIASAYSLNGIEGMSTGMPIIANLENEMYTKVFKRYSYLSDCPVISATPETLKKALKKLIINPELRENIGKESRKYVEIYHADLFAQIMFERIYDKIWYKRDVDLINFFHPILGTYLDEFKKRQNA